MAENGDKSVSAAGLAEAVEIAAKGGPPPVHLWNPPYCGEMDLLIRADGTWLHEGSPIGRPAMVRLFAGILKREGDRFFLVSPVEKLGIRVEDAPFLATDAEIAPGRVTFTTNVGDRVEAGPDHAIILRGSAEAPRPYVHVRAGLEALIDRKTFYRLAAGAAPGPEGRIGIEAGGQFFALEP
ncbi:DUF1285 domain-containing protein [Paracoccus liaowanqingii]|uniref:DUF1285 domain-containing protein n=1 Tax=Paracoccus liaowanqingii TaxID=2560053 RepID=A0A4P7HKL4_9RHOB|nr:DUF1285 domain-containing protein [Paracoccus liaowanqingii]QBX34655.1 DUF1285 domain-containing protein [Paracoccus liaowanqingii]TGN42309.1 DUF1285 domain-containing protein [Paracoccus liaowanqingii]